MGAWVTSCYLFLNKHGVGPTHRGILEAERSAERVSIAARSWQYDSNPIAVNYEELRKGGVL